MKVYGGHYFIPSEGQCRTFVAAKSQKECAKLLKVSPNHIRTMWAVTGNSLECEIALNEPRQIFYFTRGNDYSGERRAIRKYRECQHYNMTLNGVCNDCHIQVLSQATDESKS